MTKKQIEKAKAKLAKQEREEKFKRVSDYVTVVAMIPFLADKIEDMVNVIYPEEINAKLNDFSEFLRSQDELFLHGADVAVIEQQDELKRSLYKWQKETFLNELK